MFVIASVPEAENISEQDLHPVSLQGASRNVCVILASQNSAYQKHTAACQTSNLALSAPQLSEQMATQDTFHISPLHGRNNQPCLENAVPCGHHRRLSGGATALHPDRQESQFACF